MRMADLYKPPEGHQHPGGLCRRSPYADTRKSGTREIKYHKKKINGEWKQLPVNIKDHCCYSDGHSFKSVYQVQQLRTLEPGETAAIRHLSGFSYALFYPLGTRSKLLSKALKGVP